MELPTLDSFGPVDRNLQVLNNDEYAFIAGSFIVVKQFKTTGDKSLRLLRSEFSHFSAMDFNSYMDIGYFATCESGRNATIRLYSYTKFHGFGDNPKGDHIFKSISETTLSKGLEATSLHLSRECDRLVALLPEPQQCLKVYEINEHMNFNTNIILTIPLEKDYSFCKICPMNKNLIFLFHKNYCSIVEIKDAFKENYQTLITEEKDINMIKNQEEMELEKRFEIRHLKIAYFIDEFVDFTWDMYNNIYIAASNGEVYLYDLNFEKIIVNVLGESKDSIRLNRCPTSILLTQRFLLCFQDNNKIACVNPYIPEKELLSFKPSIGVAENFRMFEIEKEFSISIFANNNYNEEQNSKNNNFVYCMKYDPEMKKIVAISKNNFYVLLHKAEILIKDKEKESLDNNENNLIINEIESYEEMKFHQGPIIGIKELGNTSQIITVGIDRKIIIWELSTRSALYQHNLDFDPLSFQTDIEGNLIFIGSQEGVLRIYDICSRNILKLVYQTKFKNSLQNFMRVDKIVVHPLMRYIVFFEIGDSIINFISGEISKNFNYIGFISLISNSSILDLSLHYNKENEILCLIKNFLISFKIENFIEHKNAIEIKQKKVQDLMMNFEIKYEMKFKRVDGDLKIIIKNFNDDLVWLTGDEKFLREYHLPVESLESIRKNSKAPTENPIRDFRGHDLEILCGIINNNFNSNLKNNNSSSNSNYIITVGIDGFLQVRKDDKEKLDKFNRTHSYIKNGINAFYYSINNKLLYTAGNDGSIFIIGENENIFLSTEIVTNSLSNEILLNLESLESLEDLHVKTFNDLIQEEHEGLIKKNKKVSQQITRAKIEEIKTELNKIINENLKLEEIEQLNKEEMIIDNTTIEYEMKKGEFVAKEKIKLYFRELCEREIIRTKLFEKTYDLMLSREESATNNSTNSSKTINNNIRMVCQSSGTKVLKTYPIRKVLEEETNRMNYVKQLRLIEINEQYKRKNENVIESIDETLFTKKNEEYLVNRYPCKIQLQEMEIRPQDVIDVNSFSEDGGKMGGDGGQFKTAKYKLQRHPYQDELNQGSNKQEENSDQVAYKPDEQLLKEDLVYKFKTVILNQNNIEDVEFSKNINEIDPYHLLYSPFELYTNFRMRNQIYLIIEIIQNLKNQFNKEFKIFINERNASLEKFNQNKLAIDNIKEILIGEGEKLLDEMNYQYNINQHEDNEWVEKMDDNEIVKKVPKYFSREEKLRQQEEIRKEEERIRLLQGDTLEMRGLKFMIELKSLNKKQISNDDGELVKEAFMEKDKKDMTEDEIRRLTEFMKKEKEIQERKDKIRSQNMTKLNSHKMEIENIKTEMDSKFLKIMKKRLYYDYRIVEQEMYVLALLRTMEYKDEIKGLFKEYKNKFNTVSQDESKSNTKLNEFSDNYKKFNNAYHSFLIFYNDKNKNNKLIEAEKSLFDNFTEIYQSEKDAEQKFRADPYFFQEREKLKMVKKYGSKPYKEISQMGGGLKGSISGQKNPQEENINLINQKYYMDYKNDQMNIFKSFLEGEQDKIELQKREIDTNLNKYESEFKKSHLNLDLMVRVKKGQDELTDINNQGPQNFIDEAYFIDHLHIEELNRKINNIYTTLKSNSNTEKDHNVILQYLELENTNTELTKHEIELKLRYLKLTRVTKKIQEIVTGREDIDQNQINLVYEQKKRNLQDNKSKRIETMSGKMRELENEIEKKKRENDEFVEKSQKLKQEVKLKEQIIDLDNDAGVDAENNQNIKLKSKSLEIAQVTKLKNLVQQYYEEIEYLRTELDRLRARTFPSFLQKPEQIIYPDEK